jgi:Homeodomain-like domain
MAMGRPKAVLVLDAALREQLEGLANSGSLPAGLERRAKIILLSASGKTNREIARQLETSKVTVSLWRYRFLRHGVSGLYDESLPDRPRSISDERVAQLAGQTRVVRIILRPVYRSLRSYSCPPVLQRQACCRFHR